MSEEMTKIDVEKIMDEIRQNIKEKGYTNDLLSFEDVEMEGISNDKVFSVDEMNRWIQSADVSGQIEHFHQVIPYHEMKNFIKKTARKIFWRIAYPLLVKQSRYNAETVRAMNQMALFVQEQIEKNKEYEEEIRQLKERIAKIENAEE